MKKDDLIFDEDIIKFEDDNNNEKTFQNNDLNTEETLPENNLNTEETININSDMIASDNDDVNNEETLLDNNLNTGETINSNSDMIASDNDDVNNENTIDKQNDIKDTKREEILPKNNITKTDSENNKPHNKKSSKIFLFLIIFLVVLLIVIFALFTKGNFKPSVSANIKTDDNGNKICTLNTTLTSFSNDEIKNKCKNVDEINILFTDYNIELALNTTSDEKNAYIVKQITSNNKNIDLSFTSLLSTNIKGIKEIYAYKGTTSFVFNYSGYQILTVINNNKVVYNKGGNENTQFGDFEEGIIQYKTFTDKGAKLDCSNKKSLMYEEGILSYNNYTLTSNKVYAKDICH